MTRSLSGGAEPRCRRGRRSCGWRVVEIVLAAERARRPAGRSVSANALDVGAGLGAPAAAAEDHERPLGLGEQRRAGCAMSAGAGCACDRLVAGRIGAAAALGQHVLGQRQHHRARAGPRSRCGRRALISSGMRAGSSISAHPLGDAAEHLRGSRSPGTPRGRACSRATWPMSRIIGVESWRAMWTPARRWWRPGRASP